MRTLLLTSLILAACGGSALNDASADDLTYGEPMHWVSMAAQAATDYAANPQLMHLEGKPAGKGYGWTFLFRGDLGYWAAVVCDGKTAQVTEHYQMIEPPLGMTAIDTAGVKITVAKLKSIASKAGCASMHAIELDQPLTVSPDPHWMADSGEKQVFVDATTGAVLQ